MLGKLEEAEIEKLLERNVMGRLGCSYQGTTYVVPINYVYDGKCIIAHSTEGRKLGMMRKNPLVCFEVDEIENQNNWRSVILQGSYEELKDEEEKYHALKKMVDRMMKLKISETARPPHLSEKRVHPHAPGNIDAVVWRIVIAEKTGRFEKL